jgi:hypothetical protein
MADAEFLKRVINKKPRRHPGLICQSGFKLSMLLKKMAGARLKKYQA